MDYGSLLLVHVGAVILSGTGFLARGVGMATGADWVARRPVRILPHVVDTVLLVSAILLAVRGSLSPFSTPWLGAKVIGLVVYILLGTVALRRGRTRTVRIVAWLGAMAVFVWIVSVAITKQPWGFLA